jgi:hypothetical protein
MHIYDQPRTVPHNFVSRNWRATFCCLNGLEDFVIVVKSVQKVEWIVETPQNCHVDLSLLASPSTTERF